MTLELNSLNAKTHIQLQLENVTKYLMFQNTKQADSQHMTRSRKGITLEHSPVKPAANSNSKHPLYRNFIELNEIQNLLLPGDRVEGM